MASPFLAITLDAKRRIARAASALGADVATWTLGYLNLLEHVWERKDARVTSLVVAACFGPDPRAPGALVEFGFLVMAGDVWDLNQEDADRLLLTHKQRVAAGKARAGGALRTGGAFASATPAPHQRATSGPPAEHQLLHPAPSTQHPEEKKKHSAPASPSPAAVVESPELRLVPTPADPKPPKRSEAQQFWDWFQAGRQKHAGRVPEGEMAPVVLNAWFKSAVAVAGLEGLQKAAIAYVCLPKDDYWRSRGFPFKGFMSDNVWRQYVPAQEGGG